ncbi:hypothetical protein RvY_10063 [Ramazzottius varieornatus]|uniref:Uncharacterized protein n=1 Tax=Ramazzottius varieornatus TaxID=947166 RepID=A0A1D1VBH6_RAMVA|nr:hypothetical protein RvY_10063 [Ramazzottius varieornatus]
MIRSFVFVILAAFASVLFAECSRDKRQTYDTVGCDPTYRYNSEDQQNKSVVAYCRYYGDRFYECTAWNRMLARNHWILSDGIIPNEMWTNRNERVRIAECKFHSNYQYRCRQPARCVGTVCERKCAWGGRYEGTPHAGFKQAVLDRNVPEVADQTSYGYHQDDVIKYKAVDRTHQEDVVKYKAVD